MVKSIHIEENKPYPNSLLPVLYYPQGVVDLVDKPNPAQKVLALLEDNGYFNGWVNGIFSYHHFHANTHEVLACIAGEATVQLGGPDAKMYSFSKGDVLLLPAGIAHKRIDASNDFKIVGAYPNGIQPDIQKGEAENYENIKRTIKRVAIPDKDPIEGINGVGISQWIEENDSP